MNFEFSTDFTAISDQELYRKCQQYGKNARLWMRQFAALLPEVAKRELFRKYGFGSIGEFAGKLAGMSREMVADILRVNQKLEDKPELKKLMPQVGWNALRVIASVATKETEQFWAEKVQTMSQGQLKILTQELVQRNIAQQNGIQMKQQNKTGQVNAASSWVDPALTLKPETVHHSFHLSFETNARLEKYKKKLEQESGSSMNFETIMKTLLDVAAPEEIYDLESEKKNAEEVCGDGVGHETVVSRHIPAAVKRYVAHLYQGMCAFPNCKKPQDEYHHTQRFSLTKNHNPKFLVPLCKIHHQFTHAGLIENEESQPSQWKVRTEKDKGAAKYATQLKFSAKNGIDRKVQAHIQKHLETDVQTTHL